MSGKFREITTSILYGQTNRIYQYYESIHFSFSAMQLKDWNKNTARVNFKKNIGKENSRECLERNELNDTARKLWPTKKAIQYTHIEHICNDNDENRCKIVCMCIGVERTLASVCLCVYVFVGWPVLYK